MQDSLTEFSYDATLGGVKYAVENTASGVQVVVQGYDDKIVRDYDRFAHLPPLLSLTQTPRPIFYTRCSLACARSHCLPSDSPSCLTRTRDGCAILRFVGFLGCSCVSCRVIDSDPIDERRSQPRR